MARLAKYIKSISDTEFLLVEQEHGNHANDAQRYGKRKSTDKRRVHYYYTVYCWKIIAVDDAQASDKLEEILASVAGFDEFGFGWNADIDLKARPWESIVLYKHINRQKIIRIDSNGKPIVSRIGYRKIGIEYEFIETLRAYSLNQVEQYYGLKSGTLSMSNADNCLSSLRVARVARALLLLGRGMFYLDESNHILWRCIRLQGRMYYLQPRNIGNILQGEVPDVGRWMPRCKELEHIWDMLCNDVEEYVQVGLTLLDNIREILK